jgi:hypothetical protein
MRQPFWLVVCVVAASVASAGEPPRKVVGTLDFFGLRHLNESDLRAHLDFKEGDPFQRAIADAEVRELEKLPRIQRATLASITTDGSGQVHLFIGIQETGTKGFVFRPKPTGDVRLPARLALAYRDCMALWGETVKRQAQEDESQGHSLSSYPPMRQTEEVIIGLMKDSVAVVKDVLKNASSNDDRIAAAWLLGYAPDKSAVITDLIAAARDTNPKVRNNATRALSSISVLAAAKPELGIHIDPTVFIEMLDSVVWTDRNKASFVLERLTRGSSSELLVLLRERSLPDLSDIARWKSEGHGLVGGLILGRIAGWSDEHTMKAWSEGHREDIIAAAAAVH